MDFQLRSFKTHQLSLIKTSRWLKLHRTWLVGKTSLLVRNWLQEPNCFHQRQRREGHYRYDHCLTILNLWMREAQSISQDQTQKRRRQLGHDLNGHQQLNSDLQSSRRLIQKWHLAMLTDQTKVVVWPTTTLPRQHQLLSLTGQTMQKSKKILSPTKKLFLRKSKSRLEELMLNWSETSLRSASIALNLRGLRH